MSVAWGFCRYNCNRTGRIPTIHPIMAEALTPFQKASSFSFFLLNPFCPKLISVPSTKPPYPNWEKDFLDIWKDQDSRFYKKYSFLKQILLSAVGLLSVFISFYKKGVQDNIQYISYSSALILNILGILTCAIVLYEEVNLSSRIVKARVERWLKRNSGENVEKYSVLNAPKIFLICEYVCYISLLLSLVCYAITAIR